MKKTYKIELTVEEIRAIHSMGILTAEVEDMDIEEPIMDFEENSKVIDKLIEKLDNTVSEYSQKEKEAQIKPVNEKEEKYFLTEDIVKQSKFGIRVENEIKNLTNRFNADDRKERILKFQEEKKEVEINLCYYTVFACIHDYHTTRKLRELDIKIKKYLDFLINFRDQVIDQLENKEVKFKYTYRVRGYSPGCQPQYGLVDVKDDIRFKFEVLTYSRKLTDKEIYEYELKSLN